MRRYRRGRNCLLPKLRSSPDSRRNTRSTGCHLTVSSCGRIWRLSGIELDSVVSGSAFCGIGRTHFRSSHVCSAGGVWAGDDRRWSSRCPLLSETTSARVVDTGRGGPSGCGERNVRFCHFCCLHRVRGTGISQRGSTPCRVARGSSAIRRASFRSPGTTGSGIPEKPTRAGVGDGDGLGRDVRILPGSFQRWRSSDRGPGPPKGKIIPLGSLAPRRSPRV